MADTPAETDRHIKNIPICDLLDLRRDLRDRTTRAYFDHLRALAEDIRLHGVRNPLKVIREGTKWRIVCGQTRKDAAALAGLSEVPCEELDPNSTKTQLNSVEVADNNTTNPFDDLALGIIYDEMMRENNWTAADLRRNEPAVDKASLSRVLSSFNKATDAVKAAYRAGELCARGMYQLSRLPAERQDADLPVCRGLSTEGIKDHVNGILFPAGLKKKPPKPVKGRTRQGLEYGFPAEFDFAKAKAEHAALGEAIKWAESQGLPLSAVTQRLARA